MKDTTNNANPPTPVGSTALVAVKRYSYAVWTGGICGAAGWQFWTWQFWAATLPMIALVWWTEREQ